MLKFMKISDIVIIEEYWPRVQLNQEIVEAYKELYEAGKILPPILVQKEKNILIDGRYRLEAQKQLGYKVVWVKIVDIPEEDILLYSARINSRHGQSLSEEDKRKVIYIARFQNKLPLQQISKESGFSYWKVRKICEELQSQMDIIGSDNTQMDLRYADGVKKTSKIKFKKQSSRPSRQDKPLPVKLTIYHLKRRFMKLNPRADHREIDWVAYVDSTLTYREVLDDFERAYPQYNWRSLEEEKYGDLANEPFWSDKNYVPLNLKFYWSGGKAYVYSTIPKKYHPYIRGRIFSEFVVKWPLDPKLNENEVKKVFHWLSDEELNELYYKHNPYTDEPSWIDEESNEQKIADYQAEQYGLPSDIKRLMSLTHSTDPRAEYRLGS